MLKAWLKGMARLYQQEFWIIILEKSGTFSKKIVEISTHKPMTSSTGLSLTKIRIQKFY